MSWFDLVLIILWVGFIFYGFSKGLIRLFGHIVGIILGAFIASHFYLQFFTWGQGLFRGHDNLGKVIVFIVLFVVVTRLTDILFVVVEKIFKLISIIPFTKLINRLLGAALGFVEGALFLGLIIFVVSRYTLISSLFGSQLSASKIAPLLLKIVNLILPILPNALKALQSII
ncbi:MAG: CvpA family protein [Candidatus Falkowbacteria bacterium]|nr:CvpA family protein [Candidatus Falkowbacteria bacterium]